MLDAAPTIVETDATASPASQAMPAIVSAVTQILLAPGEDPAREGLVDTPQRVARMYQEIFSGLREDPRTHLATQFCADRHEDVVVVKDISFFSMCEHHLLPFFGRAHVAYLPKDGRLAGLSKIARVVQTLSRRPQLQERLSSQIADTVWSALQPKGVLVMVEAEHLCMAMRGVRSPQSTTLTVVSRGELETNERLRAEAFRLLKS